MGRGRRCPASWSLGALALDAAVLTGRIDRLDVELPAGPGETWVLVGLDSRAELPAGADGGGIRHREDVPGSRADVVLVVHSAGDRTTVLSVPRDVVAAGDVPGRLALSWLDGPQSTVDALCGLGIAADHLVAIDLAGFAAVVDAVGGLDVDVPAPVRDPAAGLELAPPGSQHVDGATALAIVRSRHPEECVDGDVDPGPGGPRRPRGGGGGRARRARRGGAGIAWPPVAAPGAGLGRVRTR